MPTIAAFYGIVIQMFWQEHGPPRSHALYAEYEVVLDVRDLRVIPGRCRGERWRSSSNGPPIIEMS